MSEIMLESRLVTIRGTTRAFTLNVLGRHDLRKLYFTVKADKNPTSQRLIDLKNDHAEGGDSQVKAVYNEADEVTAITIYTLPVHTQGWDVNADYYWELTSEKADDSTDVLKPTGGDFVVEASVRNETDGDPVPTDNLTYAGMTHVYKFKITPPSTFKASENNFGFDGTINPTVSGDVITLTNTEAEFSSLFRVKDTQGGAQRKAVTTTTYEIQLPPDWETDWDVDEITVYKEEF